VAIHLRTPHVTISRGTGESFVRIARTAEPIRSLAEIDVVEDALERAAPKSERDKLGLLMDVREAPLRNDPEFEQTIAPRVARLGVGFARTAVLVRTAIGKLQVARQSRGATGSAIATFDDEKGAIAFVASVRDSDR
jgi:hypothetical protein